MEEFLTQAKEQVLLNAQCYLHHGDSKMEISVTKGPVYMGKITSPARPGADKRSKFQALFIWAFHAWSERRGKSQEVVYRPSINDFPL